MDFVFKNGNKRSKGKGVQGEKERKKGTSTYFSLVEYKVQLQPHLFALRFLVDACHFYNNKVNQVI